jgi:sterol desaturase/sphingolipid hydroxylase (fatty acid hydroxylase superfamily)
MTFAQQILSSASSVAGVIVAMSLVAVLEFLIPLRRGASRAHVGPNLALTAIVIVTNVLLTAMLVLVLAWLSARDLGLLGWMSTPWPLDVALAIVTLDLATWLAHRAMHRLPALWRFHRVHHCDAFVDVTTTIRQHPGESLVRFGFIAAAAIVLGVTPAALALHRLWSVLTGLLEHANIRLPARLDALLSAVIVTPDMHKVHHSRVASQTDTNYGNLFSCWDRLFGTFTPSRHGRSVTYGLDGLDDRVTTASLLRLPFDRGAGAPRRATA